MLFGRIVGLITIYLDFWTSLGLPERPLPSRPCTRTATRGFVHDHRRFNATKTPRCLQQIQIGDSQSLLALINLAIARAFQHLFRCFIHLQLIFPPVSPMPWSLHARFDLKHLDVLQFVCVSHHFKLICQLFFLILYRRFSPRHFPPIFSHRVFSAGGIGVIHTNLSIEAQAEQVARVKKFKALWAFGTGGVGW